MPRSEVLLERSTTKCTFESGAAFVMFVHVADVVVVLLGLGVPVGTTTLTVYVAFEPPARVMLTPGVGTMPIVSKRSGIVKFVLGPRVAGE